MTPRVVGVNLLWLVPGVVGGSEEYTLRLLRAVDDLEPDDLTLRLYGQPSLVRIHPDLAERFPVATTRFEIPSRAGRVAAEHLWLAGASRHDDLVHHAGGVAPAFGSRPIVLTVHDLQPLDLPQNFSSVKRRWLETMLPRSARRADLTLCPSRFSADRVVERLGVPQDRVRVVPHGHQPTEPGVLDAARHRQNLDRFGRFVLLPAIAYPHKRHRDLVDAVELLGDRAPDITAVMTGGEGPETRRLRADIEARGLGRRCHFLGRVSEDELDSLYRSAVALVFPSIYEGFGNPTLEAMARGCPVIAADATATPEVVGDAGLLVAPRQPAAVADAIHRVVSEPGLADDLRQRGLVRAARFGWHRAGQCLVDAYRDGLG